RRGRVVIEWERVEAEPPQLALVWREEGGPPVSPPTRRGFGSLLLEATLAQDLDGQVHADFRPEGLICRIEAPLSQEAAEAAGAPSRASGSWWATTEVSWP